MIILEVLKKQIVWRISFYFFLCFVFNCEIQAENTQLPKASENIVAPQDILATSFGSAVCIHENQLFVGVPEASKGIGIIIVFENDGFSWKESGRITGTGENRGRSFGTALGILDDLLFVGIPERNVVVVYKFLGTQFEQVAEIENQSGFGASIRSDGDSVFVLDSTNKEFRIQINNNSFQPLVVPSFDNAKEHSPLPIDRIAVSSKYFAIGMPGKQNNQTAGKVSVYEIKGEEKFISESEVEEIITEACMGLEEDTTAYKQCVEPVLHNLWEERKILYTTYDRIIKRAWNIAEVKQVKQGERQLLFDAYMEMNKLERQIVIVHGRMVQSSFTRVNAALNGKTTLDAKKTEAEYQAKLNMLQQVLRDLLQNDPELPPSPYLEAPYTGETSPAVNTSTFKNVGPSIGKTNTPVEEPSFINRFKEFFSFDLEKRRDEISARRRMKEIQEQVFKNTNRALFEPNLTPEEQRRLSVENNTLQKELTGIAQSMHEKYGK